MFINTDGSLWLKLRPEAGVEKVIMITSLSFLVLVCPSVKQEAGISCLCIALFPVLHELIRKGEVRSSLSWPGPEEWHQG